MSYKLEQFDEGRIVLNTLGEDFDIVRDMVVSAQESILLFDNGPDRIVLITDARLVKIKSLEEILQGGKLINDERVKRATKHPKMIRSLSVVNSKVLQLALKGLNSASFGHTDIPVYESLEEAFNIARKLIYGEATSAG